MEFDVFDVHHHVGDARAVMAISEENPEPLDTSAYRQRESEERLAIMDEGGVRQALVIPGHGYARPRGIADTRVENDRIAAYRDALPDPTTACHDFGEIHFLWSAIGAHAIDRT